MSKIISVENSPFKNTRVYRLVGRRRKIHEDYGLWIFFGATSDAASGSSEPVPRVFEFYNISHMWGGHGWFWTPAGGRRTLEAGNGVTLCPGVVHDYDGFDYYKEDFICFSGPVADHLAKSGILRPGPLRIGPARVLLPIIKMAANPDRDSQIKANIALQNLLVELHLANKREDESGRGDAIGSLLRELARRPSEWVSVPEMAEMAGLSVNQFIRVFSLRTGLTPKKYVDTLKAQKAAEALLNSSRTLAEIADELGFRDPFHLSKRFKEITGLSPSEYRKQKTL